VLLVVAHAIEVAEGLERGRGVAVQRIVLAFVAIGAMRAFSRR